MLSQSGDNVRTAAPGEEHKNPGRRFPGVLSDPTPAYHTLHTLKHGYPFLDTLLTFKCGRWEETRPVFHRTEESGGALTPGWPAPRTLELWLIFESHSQDINSVCCILKW